MCRKVCGGGAHPPVRLPMELWDTCYPTITMLLWIKVALSLQSRSLPLGSLCFKDWEELRRHPATRRCRCLNNNWLFKRGKEDVTSRSINAGTQTLLLLDAQHWCSDTSLKVNDPSVKSRVFRDKTKYQSETVKASFTLRPQCDSWCLCLTHIWLFYQAQTIWGERECEGFLSDVALNNFNSIMRSVSDWEWVLGAAVWTVLVSAGLFTLPQKSSDVSILIKYLEIIGRS